MLVLSRKSGESIVIDGDIRIKVVRSSGNRVSLAIEAPHDVLVEREEIWRRRQEFQVTTDAADVSLTFS